MVTKPRRRDLIAQLVHARPIQSQQELQEALAAKRVRVNQATLSRDLQDMGVLKGPAGYVLPTDPATVDTSKQSLSNMLRRELRSIEYSGNTVVLRTDAGHANALAVELARSRLDDILGTIAGDDTIFGLIQRDRSAARLTRRLRDMASVS